MTNQKPNIAYANKYSGEREKLRITAAVVSEDMKPDFNAKIEILRQKAGIEGVELPDDVGQFIAHNSRANIRALENKMTAYSRLCDIQITLDLAKKLFRRK